MKKTIYYWSPCLTKIATIKATMNSAVSLAKYSNSYKCLLMTSYREIKIVLNVMSRKMYYIDVDTMR